MGRLKKDDIEGHKRIEEIKKKCAEIGITYDCFRQRIKNGWTEEQALIAPTINVKQPLYLYKGESARQYIMEHGGNYSVFMYHVKTKSIDKAVELTLNHRGNKKYFRDGMTLARWCEFNGKNYYSEYIKQRKLDKEKKSGIIAS